MQTCGKRTAAIASRRLHPAAAPSAGSEAQFFARDRPTSLLQRMIKPDEIANLLSCIASPLAAATHGAALRLDGGLTPAIA